MLGGGGKTPNFEFFLLRTRNNIDLDSYLYCLWLEPTSRFYTLWFYTSVLGRLRDLQYIIGVTYETLCYILLLYFCTDYIASPFVYCIDYLEIGRDIFMRAVV